MTISNLIHCLRRVEKHEMSRAKQLIEKCEGKILILGNGGSNAVASHIAEDFTKNYKPSMSFSDAPMMSCFSNDFGWDAAYLIWLKRFYNEGDLVILISSSGESTNILSCAEWCQENNVPYITMSGFSQHNELRAYGWASFYVGSDIYGSVEITHLAILHTILDELMANRNE